MNVILEHRIEKNTKLNKIARIGYFCTSTYDPFGITSFIFAIIQRSNVKITVICKRK